MTYRYHSEDPIKRKKLTPNRDNLTSRLSLTEEQLHELKCYFVNDYVNDLSVNELKDIVYENMLDNLEDWDQTDVINEVKNTFNKAYFNELIHQIMYNKSPPITDPW